MTAIDFSRSYMRWVSTGNSVRIMIDAACTLIDDMTNESHTYYLIAPCRGEETHADGDLIKDPGYEFCGVWGENEVMITRWHWASERDNRQHKPKGDILDIRSFAETRSLADNEAVYAATMESSEPLISRTTVRDDKRGVTAVLEYPIRTINVVREPVTRFQVDTGPLIIPDFTRDTVHLVEQFEMAYVVYNRFDEAEFTLRKPVDIGGAMTTDYSEIRILPAKNEVLLAV